MMASPMPGTIANALMRPTQGPGRFSGVAPDVAARRSALAPRMPTGPAMPPQANPSPNPLMGNNPLNPTVTPRPGEAPGPIMPGMQEPPQPSVARRVFRSPAGLADRVSTRIPYAANLAYDPHDKPLPDLSANGGAMLPEGHGFHHFTDGHDDAQKKIGAAMEKHADLIRKEYPFINTEGLTHGGVLERFVEHAHHNIVDLWNRVRDRPWRDQAVDWYRGANRMAAEMSQRYGVTHRQAAAAIATLSPQKDWDMNVSLADRVMNSHANHQDAVITPQMRDFMQKKVDARTESRRAELDQYLNGGTHAKTGEVYAPMLEGMRYRDLTHPMQKALFIRAMDEMHAPDRGYDIISPSGNRTRAQRGGKEATTDWGGFGEIANAVRALESNNHLPTISRALGMKHKVRNFYNNIISPDAAAYLQLPHHDVTADTHAINGTLMLPMGGQHRMVAQGLGTSGQAHSGMNGLYGLHADAYRRAAQTISQQEGRQYLPREVQSVVWEAVRNLWKKEHKKLDKDTKMPSHEVGKTAQGAAFAVRHGFMPPGMARDAVIQAAGGISDPNWHTGIGTVEDEE